MGNLSSEDILYRNLGRCHDVLSSVHIIESPHPSPAQPSSPPPFIKHILIVPAGGRREVVKHNTFLSTLQCSAYSTAQSAECSPLASTRLVD